MSWAGSAEDCADWIAGNDQAIADREQQRRRATVARMGDAGEIG